MENNIFDINDFSKQFVKAAQEDPEKAAELLATKIQVKRILDNTKPSIKQSFETVVSSELSQVASVQVVEGKPIVLARDCDPKVEKAIVRAYEKLQEDEKLKLAL